MTTIVGTPPGASSPSGFIIFWHEPSETSGVQGDDYHLPWDAPINLLRGVGKSKFAPGTQLSAQR
ncbi:MAG: hypothetical protein ACRES5_08590 [Pseudomonas sp.]